jgi:hypothetical protein
VAGWRHLALRHLALRHLEKTGPEVEFVPKAHPPGQAGFEAASADRGADPWAVQAVTAIFNKYSSGCRSYRSRN